MQDMLLHSSSYNSNNASGQVENVTMEPGNITMEPGNTNHILHCMDDPPLQKSSTWHLFSLVLSAASRLV